MSKKTDCIVDGCDRGGKITRGLCNMHYQRAKKASELADLPRLKNRRGSVRCTFDGCDRTMHARGYCATHYDRWSKHGDASIVLKPSSCAIRGDIPTYSTIHFRLKRSRGRASNYGCVDCGGTAQEWSYNNADPNEYHATVAGGFSVAYSLDLANYEPRCSPCHRRFDATNNQQDKEKTA